MARLAAHPDTGSAMNENHAEDMAIALQGKMFLYEQPELLTRDQHGTLGLSVVERPYDFAKSTRAIPLVAGEISSAQKHYPVAFADMDNPVPLAIVGILDDVNLFVDENGQWDRWAYIPSYLRRYPFAFATGKDDHFAIVVDRAAAVVTDDPQFPFFDGDELSENTQAQIDFCGQYEAERRRTETFGRRLKELELLTPQKAAHRVGDNGDEQPIASYAAVDVNKLNELDRDILQTLHQEGSLAAIFAHLFSLENWNRLLDRRNQRLQASGDGTETA